jgi:hypothetical protein
MPFATNILQVKMEASFSNFTRAKVRKQEETVFNIWVESPFLTGLEITP